MSDGRLVVEEAEPQERTAVQAARQALAAVRLELADARRSADLLSAREMSQREDEDQTEHRQTRKRLDWAHEEVARLEKAATGAAQALAACELSSYAFADPELDQGCRIKVDLGLSTAAMAAAMVALEAEDWKAAAERLKAATLHAAAAQKLTDAVAKKIARHKRGGQLALALDA